MADTYSTSPEQRKVITDYAELVSLAYTEAVDRTNHPDVAFTVAKQVAEFLVPAAMQEYAQAMAAKPRIQVAPKLLAS